MNEEAGFLASIQKCPADETARLVYADWLEERGDEASKAKADFIRLELQLSTAPEQSLNRVRWRNKLQKLAATLDARWLAIVSHPRLEACRMQFEFECPKQWDKLTPTSDARRRHCDQCQQDVHFCDSLREARNHAAQGHCVAISAALVRRAGDMVPRPRAVGIALPPRGIRRMGRMLPHRIAMPVVQPTEVPEPSPPPEPPPPAPRSPRQPPRPKRGRNRSIEREDWEAEE